MPTTDTGQSQDLSAREILALNIADCLAANEMTQADLCRRTGLAPSTITSYVTASRYPRAECLEKIADALHTTVSALTSSGADSPALYGLKPLVQRLATESLELTPDQLHSVLDYVGFLKWKSENNH